MTHATLVLLSYGEGAHVAETEYTALAAWRAGRGTPGRTLLYTDAPERFAHLPVDLRPVTAAELRAWRGPYGYHHRIKGEVVADALAATGGPVALVDSDTWWRRPPAALLARLVPGTVVLHLSEGPLRASNDPAKHAFAARVAGRVVPTPGGDLAVDAGADVWNSGVIGVHPADAHVVRDALAVMDGLWPGNEDVFFLEQFAVCQVALARSRVRPSDDVVYHYWPAALRAPWQPRLARLLAETAGLPLEERAERLHRERPRPRGREALRYRAKLAYRRAGFTTPGVRSSAT